MFSNISRYVILIYIAQMYMCLAKERCHGVLVAFDCVSMEFLLAIGLSVTALRDALQGERTRLL